MRIWVPVGTYRFLEDKKATLVAGPSGMGVIVGAYSKEKSTALLAFYLFPSQSFEINGALVFSGGELFWYLEEELNSKKLSPQELTWLIAGASRFKKGLERFDLAEKNVSLAKNFLQKRLKIESVFEFTFKSSYVIVEVNSQLGGKILHNGGEICL